RRRSVRRTRSAATKSAASRTMRFTTARSLIACRTMLSRRRTLLALASLGLLGCRRDRPSSTPPSADATLILANVRSNDPARPVAEALLVRDGRIAALGSAAELDTPGARVIDWRDATV